MRVPVFALVATLALPAAAGAKEITGVSVCGVDACTHLTDHATLQAFMHAGSMAEEAPNEPQRSYLLRLRISEPGGHPVQTWTSRWLPDAGLIASREDGGGLVFTGVDPAVERVLRRAARGHAARPPKRFVRHDPVARVVEVVEPPAPAPRPATADASGSLWLAWAGAGVLLLLGAAGAWRARRGLSASARHLQ